MKLKDITSDNKSHSQKIIDFSIDQDGKNRWKLTGFIRAVNPALYDNPNLGALQNYINSGMGYCHVCGHSPIVNHYVVLHPEKGSAFVGSECIGKVLGASVEKAVKTVTGRTVRNYNNKLKLASLLAQYEEFFNLHPELLGITSGYYISRYVKYHSKCFLTVSVEKFIEEHKDCSDFMAEAHRTHSRGMVNAVYDHGCKKCMSYKTWEAENRNNPDYHCKCENDNAILVSDLSEVKPVEGCPNPTLCWVYEPVNPEVSGSEILGKIKQAYDRNYKDISFIYNDIKNFNKWHVKVADKKYEGNVPVEIPHFDGRNFNDRPLTEHEETERANFMSQAIDELVKGK